MRGIRHLLKLLAVSKQYYVNVTNKFVLSLRHIQNSKVIIGFFLLDDRKDFWSSQKLTLAPLIRRITILL